MHQLMYPRGGAQTKPCDDKALVEGESKRTTPIKPRKSGVL